MDTPTEKLQGTNVCPMRRCHERGMSRFGLACHLAYRHGKYARLLEWDKNGREVKNVGFQKTLAQVDTFINFKEAYKRYLESIKAGLIPKGEPLQFKDEEGGDSELENDALLLKTKQFKENRTRKDEDDDNPGPSSGFGGFALPSSTAALLAK